MQKVDSFMGVVANFILFLIEKEFWRSHKFWPSYTASWTWRVFLGHSE